MLATKRLFSSLGLPDQDPRDCPSSPLLFADGGQYRIEIPSTEGPKSLEAVVDEAAWRNVPIHRVSQGSGIMMLTDDEITQMVTIGQEEGIEVNLFVGPRANFDIGAQAYSAAGKSLSLAARGSDQLFYSILDVRRAVGLGVRSVLVSDLGVLQLVSKMRAAGDLPPELIIKTSVMMAPANPASARLLQDLGADTINIPSDVTLSQIAGIRAALTVPIDFYIEAPDNIGGFIRYYEAPELIRVAAPVYLKFGVRNAPDIYPVNTNLVATAIALSRERVRRAQLVRELIARHAPEAMMSPVKKKTPPNS